MELEDGTLAIPRKKTGKNLHPDAVNNVLEFYENNQFLRKMPGWKDFVSIATKIFDDFNYDTVFVNKVIKKVCEHIKTSCPNIKHLKYLSDGCAGQYKNFKNFLSLCCHKDDFG